MNKKAIGEFQGTQKPESLGQVELYCSVLSFGRTYSPAVDGDMKVICLSELRF